MTKGGGGSKISKKWWRLLKNGPLQIFIELQIIVLKSQITQNGEIICHYKYHWTKIHWTVFPTMWFWVDWLFVRNGIISRTFLKNKVFCHQSRIYIKLKDGECWLLKLFLKVILKPQFSWEFWNICILIKHLLNRFLVSLNKISRVLYTLQTCITLRNFALQIQ